MLEKPFRLTIAGSLLATSCLVATPVLSDERVSVMVFDASGSMWNRLEDGNSRIEVAREVIEAFSGSRDSSVPFGVVAYGHNRRGDCADIETVLSLGTYSGEEISRTIGELNPQGMTPLTDAMALARDMIPPTAESADIILVTDGLENCGGDPCALAADIAAEGINIRAHVVGFAMQEEAVQTLSCVPEQTGGQLFTTQSGEELSTALNRIAVPDPEPEPEEVRVEPELPLAEIHAPDSAPVGSTIEVRWDGPEDERDAIVIVEPGAPEGASGHSRRASSRVDGNESVSIQMPDALGTFELRYVHGETDATLASREIVLTPVEASVSAPEEIGAGARFDVEWEGPVNRNDYVVIVEAGAPDDDTGHGRSASSRVSESGEAVTIQAPDALGTFEVRYVIRDSRRVLASQEVTLTPVSASLEAPETVLPGADFEVHWQGPQNRRDYIAIVAPDAPEGDSGDSRSASRRASGDSVTLTAPGEEGEYEIRYVINDSDRTLAAIPITVGGTDVSLSVDGPVETGGVVEVSFTGPGRFEDLIEIIEAGGEPGDSALQDARASQGSPVQLFAPSRAGSYEIRYRASDSGEVLASIPLEVQ